MAFPSDQELEDEIFTSLDLPGLDLKGRSLVQCRFTGCNLMESDWRNAHFSDCRFDACNLSLIRVAGARFQSVSFKNCKIQGVSFIELNPFILSMHFEDCRILDADFSRLSLKGTGFERCEVLRSDFTQANLEGADFSGATLEGSLFDEARLLKARLVGATNYRIDPRTTRLDGTLFSLPEALSLLTALGIEIEP